MKPFKLGPAPNGLVDLLVAVGSSKCRLYQQTCHRNALSDSRHLIQSTLVGIGKKDEKNTHVPLGTKHVKLYLFSSASPLLVLWVYWHRKQNRLYTLQLSPRTIPNERPHTILPPLFFKQLTRTKTDSPWQASLFLLQVNTQLHIGPSQFVVCGFLRNGFLDTPETRPLGFPRKVTFTAHQPMEMSLTR